MKNKTRHNFVAAVAINENQKAPRYRATMEIENTCANYNTLYDGKPRDQTIVQAVFFTFALFTSVPQWTTTRVAFQLLVSGTTTIQVSGISLDSTVEKVGILS